MQILPNTFQAQWNSIIAGYYKTDERIEIGEETYDKNDIESSYIDLVLFDDLSIGNVTAGQAQIVLKGAQSINIGDTVVFRQRVRNTTTTSVWVNRGTFFVYSAKVDDNGAKTTVTAYDNLYKTDYPFMKSGTWESQTALQVVQAIATDIGVTIDSATQTLLTNTVKTIPYIPSIGENGTTARQLLSYIAVMYGGNWTIIENGYLKLVFANYTSSVVTVADDFEKAKFIPKYAEVDRVRIWTGNETYIQSPADEDTFDALTGYILEADCPYANQTLANNLLAQFEGVEYQPYEATKVFLNPLAQLGDGITIGGKQTVIGQIKTSFTNTSPSDIGANGVEDEKTYNYESPEERRIKQASAELSAQLEVINGQIRADVADAIASVRTSITQTASDLTVEIGAVADELAEHAEEQLHYIRYSEEGLELGESTTSAKAVLTPTGLELISPDNDTGAELKLDQTDGRYKLFVYGGHFVNYMELGDHWLLVASGSDNDHRLTFRARG